MTDKLQPPTLTRNDDGQLNPTSLANLLEWFLNNDQKVAIVRHPFVQELFEWKQADDTAKGTKVFPFENAEARFAVGVFQALLENNSEAKLQIWITDLLSALHQAKEMNSQIAESYRLGEQEGKSEVEKSLLIPSRSEQNLYLLSCWIESLSTAEVRFLGWVFQSLYGKPFQPAS